MPQCKGVRGWAQVSEWGYNAGVPLSPMYPPREEREETLAPVNEFAQAMWFGAVWMVWGLLDWVMAANGRRALLRVLFGVGSWINAWSIRTGWTSKRRWCTLGAYFGGLMAATYFVGW